MEKEVVLVTGSSRGIGKSCVIEFCKKGYNVIINYNNSKEEAENLKSELETKYDCSIKVIQADVSNSDEVKKMVSEIIEHFGHIDVLVNNAAIEVNSDFFAKSKDSFTKVLETNLIGTFLVSQMVGKHMMERKKGRIINISSNNSINKYSPETLEYDTSKAGINILTKSMAQVFAPFVNVNAVAPGWVLTEKNKELDEELQGQFVKSESEKICLKRFAEPEEIAKVVLFLAGHDASYINGEIIVVDGGNENV